MDHDGVWTTRPVTPERFDDFADVLNPTRRSTHCWCLSHRLRAKDIDALGDGSRESAARALAGREGGFGVITYRDGLPVGWCHIAREGWTSPWRSWARARCSSVRGSRWSDRPLPSPARCRDW